MIWKYLALVSIFLLYEVCLISSASTSIIEYKNVITVDDEPGDADFTSIKEAVDYCSPGDTIQVYSGIYNEDGIYIEKENISLLGISHELGEGNDTGKPFIKGNGSDSVIDIEASHVIVSNFTIENPDKETMNFTCDIFVQRNPGYEQNNITIENCNITSSAHTGIYVSYIRDNICIINNYIYNCFLDGINIMSYSPISSFIISGNIITDCKNSGIEFMSNDRNISGNKIKRCKLGISFGGNNNVIYGNDIENCNTGISYGGNGNIITMNNFKNYSRIGFWFNKLFFYPVKNRWIANYWDTWSGIGPMKILGFSVIGWRLLFFQIQLLIPIPWFEFDCFPSYEPYDI